jgi:hypothetical protein
MKPSIFFATRRQPNNRAIRLRLSSERINKASTEIAADPGGNLPCIEKTVENKNADDIQPIKTISRH